MPRFFFHVVDGIERLEDPEGLELADEAAAKKMAVQIALEIMAELLRNGETVNGQIFEIADDTGKVILLLPFKAAIPN
jgi:hypothetical protein